MSINAISATTTPYTDASSHSVLDNDAPPGIEQETWDKADVDERRSLIAESTQKNWLSSTLNQMDSERLSSPTWFSQPAPTNHLAGTLLSATPSFMPDMGISGTTQDVLQEGAQKPTTLFPYSEKATQDTATELPIQFGLAQEMKVDKCKRTTYANPADVTIGFIGTKVPLSNTSIEGVIGGMPRLRKEARDVYKINSSAVGAFQFLNSRTTRTTAERVFGATTNLKEIPFNGLSQMAMFRQRFNEATAYRTRNNQKGMMEEWESLGKNHLNTNSYIREGAENKNGLFSYISAELAMDFIPYMELGSNMKNKDGTLKPSFNPVRDEVYSTYSTTMDNLGQSLKKGIDPVEEKFISLKNDERTPKDVIDEYFSSGLRYNDSKGNSITGELLRTSWTAVNSMIDKIQKEVPDITAAQALYLIDTKYKEKGFVETTMSRVPFTDPVVRGNLKLNDMITQARNYLSPERSSSQRIEGIKEKSIGISKIMEDYEKLQNDTFKKLILVMGNDGQTHTQEFWKKYNAEAVKREELGRRLLGFHETISR